MKKLLTQTGRTAVVAVAGGLALAGLPAAPAAVAAPETPGFPAVTGLSLDDAVTAYAPVVYLHEAEKYRPMTAATFVRASKLKWHHDGCGDDDVDLYPDAPRMARGEYQHQTKSERNFFGGCDHETTVYLSNEDIRPRDGDNAAGGEGMYLDMADSLRGGEGTKAPVYYDVRGKAGSRAINYWFLFGFSQPNIQKAPDFWHEGDWEHVTVLLGAGNRAKGFYYAQHHGGCLVPTDGRDRPTVYSAEGSHASYPKPGTYTIDGPGPWNVKDAAGAGPLWDARGKLRPLNGEAWYGKEDGEGYGGGWGQVRDNKDMTGPQGPHRAHKTGLPQGSPGSCPEPDN